MKTRGLSVSILCAALLPLLSGACHARTDASTSLEKAQVQFHASLEQIDAEYTDSLKSYRDTYVKSLKGLEQQFIDAGQLEPVLAVRAEKVRFQKENAPARPASDAPKDLVHLQTRFIEVLKAARKRQTDRSLTLIEQYLHKLETLQSDLVRKKRIDDALAVKQEADNTRLVQADVENRARNLDVPELPPLEPETPQGEVPRADPDRIVVPEGQPAPDPDRIVVPGPGEDIPGPADEPAPAP